MFVSVWTREDRNKLDALALEQEKSLRNLFIASLREEDCVKGAIICRPYNRTFWTNRNLGIRFAR